MPKQQGLIWESSTNCSALKIIQSFYYSEIRFLVCGVSTDLGTIFCYLYPGDPVGHSEADLDNYNGTVDFFTGKKYLKLGSMAGGDKPRTQSHTTMKWSLQITIIKMVVRDHRTILLNQTNVP